MSIIEKIKPKTSLRYVIRLFLLPPLTEASGKIVPRTAWHG